MGHRDFCEHDSHAETLTSKTREQVGLSLNPKESGTRMRNPRRWLQVAKPRRKQGVKGSRVLFFDEIILVQL